MSHIKDRRRFTRYDCSFRVKYFHEDNVFCVENNSIAKNVSKGGLRLGLSKVIKKGDLLKLNIYTSDEEKPLPAEAKVKWTKEEGAGDSSSVDAGVEFTDIKPNDVYKLLLLAQ